MSPDEWGACLDGVRGAGIRIVGYQPVSISEETLRDFRRIAARHGYILVDAHRDMPELDRRQLWHRHVALVHHGEVTSNSARWIRELAMASPRAHVVLCVTTLPDRVHECGPAAMHAPITLPDAAATERRLRGERLWRRGREAAARRWTGAAIEYARWSRDELGAAAAFNQLIRYSDTGDQTLLDRGRRLLAEVDRLTSRSRVVADLANLWIGRGDFEAATAALSAIDVECTLSHLDVPPWIRGPQCELACWQGHWDRLEALTPAPSLNPWRAVAAMAKRDFRSVRQMAEAMVNAPPELAAWFNLIAVMACVDGVDRCEIGTALARVRTDSDDLRWRDALVLDSLQLASADTYADEWVRTRQSRPRGPAEQLLWEWTVRGRSAGNRDELTTVIRRMGAEGIRRFGIGRQDMQMWAGVAALLTQVHESDDPGVAMRRGCRWAREYTGVDRVGILSSDGVVCASDPEELKPSDWTAGIAEPVRYGGITIGHVRLQGVAREEREGRAVAAALGTACAPALRAQLDELLVARAGEALAGELLGVSPAIRDLRQAVARAAASTFPVLIEGESGTGKELVARAVHRLGPRRDRRWAAVNCAALTDELLEAELFGHTRGAFTGAVGHRIGLLEDVHEGTLFLDEVAELSARAQAKLLRVLQEGEVRRVGENASRRVDVRIVAATNRSLVEIVRQGSYREDLVFRLAVIRLRVPPLRERIEDVPILAHAFWRGAAARVATRALIAPDAVAALCRFPWPGNVRELQNVMAALAVGGPSHGRIGARHVEAVLAEHSCGSAVTRPMSLATARQINDRQVVAASLARHGNQRGAAARELGVSRQGLTKLIARLDLNGQDANQLPAAGMVASEGLFR